MILDPDDLDALEDLNDLWEDPGEALESSSAPRAADEVLIFGRREPPRSSVDVLLDEILSGIMASTHPILGPSIQEERRRVPRLADLLAMGPSRQRKAVQRPPYRDLVLANCLLDESTRLASKRPDEAERCALLAEWIAKQPWPEESEKAASVRINALIAQGEVLRLHRAWRKAELRFAAAYALLRDQPARDAHSTFCMKFARLRADQGRYDEAVLLQMYAMRVHCTLWSSDRLPSEGVYRLAIFALKQNDPGRAMTILTQLFLDQESDPMFGWVHSEIEMGRAICLAAFGHADDARSVIAEARPRWRRIDDRATRLSFEWLESRIAVHLGDLDQAIPRLEAIRRWLIAEGELDKVCLSSIDLALAHAKKGQATQRLPGLLADIARLPGAGEKPWALGSLWRFREALEHGQDPAAAARAAAEIVHRREMSLKRLAARRYTKS